MVLPVFCPPEERRVSDSLKDRLVSAAIHTDVMGSDHCPVEVVIGD